MKLTRCPHCQSLISESALACAYCKLWTARGWRVMLAVVAGITVAAVWILWR